MKISQICCLLLCLFLLSVAGKRRADKQKSKHKPRLSIYNGKRVQPGEANFMVHIASPIKGTGLNYVCGGSLIDSRTVITAAHCVHDKHKNIYEKTFVEYGSVNLKEIPESQKIKVAQVIPHPAYLRQGHDYDIAILRLPEESKIEPNKNVGFIKMSNKHTPKLGDQARIYGWGKSNYGCEGKKDEELKCSKLLMKTVLNIHENNECLTKDDVKGAVDNRICAQSPNTSGCLGDSGSAMIFKDRLVGVVSYILTVGNKDCHAGMYNVFTSIEFNYQWIQNTLKALKEQDDLKDYDD